MCQPNKETIAAIKEARKIRYERKIPSGLWILMSIIFGTFLWILFFVSIFDFSQPL